MTEDLVTFLHDRLDDDDEAARDAGGSTSGRWARESYGCIIDANQQLVVYGEGTPTRERADHIVRHDPARVLREVAAKRLLIDDITAERHLVVDGDGWYTCAAATEERDGGECYDELAGDECNCGRDARVERRLRLLALAHADYPDYRAEWRP